MLAFNAVGMDAIAVVGQLQGGASGVAPGATLIASTSIAPGAATGDAGTINGVAPGAVLFAIASIVVSQASGGISAQAPGSAMISLATIIGGAAREIFYDSLPAPDSRTIRVEIEVRVVLVPQ